MNLHGVMLPGPLQRRLEKLASDFMQPPHGPEVDFSLPPGEGALVPPESASWVIFKNPVSLAIGGIAAVILELAEPKVRTGVWEHTSFRSAPLPRLQRTGLAAMMTVYGPRRQAEALIARVNRLHSRVQGTTPQGQAYRADDQELLDWVQATAVYGFSEAYSLYVRGLTPAERDAVYAEGAVAARLYGAQGAPQSQAAMSALFQSMRPRLEPSPIVLEFLEIMLTSPLLPSGSRWFQRLLVKAAVDVIPPWSRVQLQLGSEWQLAGWERALVKLAASCADRVILQDSPAVQSCRRMGLPDDHLYRRRPRGSDPVQG